MHGPRVLLLPQKCDFEKHQAASGNDPINCPAITPTYLGAVAPACFVCPCMMPLAPLRSLPLRVTCILAVVWVGMCPLTTCLGSVERRVIPTLLAWSPCGLQLLQSSLSAPTLLVQHLVLPCTTVHLCSIRAVV